MTGEPQRRIFDDFAGHLFRRAQQRHAALWNRIVSDQVTGPQWATLAVIAERPGASQREVSAALDLDSSTIAALVARLEERDLLIREIDQDDARRRVLQLTDEGAAVHAELRPRVAELQDALMRSLSAQERAELQRLILTILADDPTDLASPKNP